MSKSEENPKISVTVLNTKTITEKKKFEVEKNTTIQEFKKVIAKYFNAQPSQLQLIFGGKILKDQDTLATYNIKDGLSIHLIIKTGTPQNNPTTTSSTNTGSAQTQRLPADINASPFNLGMNGGFPIMESMDSENLVDPMYNIALMIESFLLNHPTVAGLIAGDPEESAYASVNDHLIADQILRFARYQLIRTEYREASEEINRNTFATPSENGGDSTGTNQSDSLNERSASMYGNVQPGRTAYTFNDPLGSMVPQINENLQVTQNMLLNSPYSESTLQAMTSNSVMTNNLPSYNPELQRSRMQPIEHFLIETYTYQLHVLYIMGFFNLRANMSALIATSGNIRASIEWLLRNEHFFY